MAVELGREHLGSQLAPSSPALSTPPRPQLLLYQRVKTDKTQPVDKQKKENGSRPRLLLDVFSGDRKGL